MHPPSAAFAIGAALAVGVTLSALAEEAGLLGAFSIRSGHDLVGGLSAVEITEGGTGFTALSDRGALIRGQITRDASGRIETLALAEPVLLTTRAGERGHRNGRDSEGLAVAPDGRVFISFEGDHRVVLHRADGDRILPAAPGFAGLEPNGSLEALAVDEQGALYTLPEISEGPEIPVFRYANGQWAETGIPREGRFRPVGADIADGRFFLLERDFSPLFGFASRIRAFSLAQEDLTGGETLWQSSHGAHANLEGLSLWRDGQGRLIASMVSDDNFSPLLPTELVEILLE